MDNIDKAVAVAIESGKSKKLVTRPSLAGGEVIWPETNERILDVSEPHGQCELLVATIEPYVHPRDATLRAHVRFHRQGPSSMLLLA